MTGKEIIVILILGKGAYMERTIFHRNLLKNIKIENSFNSITL